MFEAYTYFIYLYAWGLIKILRYKGCHKWEKFKKPWHNIQRSYFLIELSVERNLYMPTPIQPLSFDHQANFSVLL